MSLSYTPRRTQPEYGKMKEATKTTQSQKIAEYCYGNGQIIK